MTTPSYSELYKGCIKEMLFGRQFICEHTNEGFFRYLSDPTQLQEVNNYLRTLDRVVRHSPGGDAFFVSYLDPEQDEYQKACHQLYSRLLNDLSSFLELLTALMACHQGSPIRPGDIIKEGQLLASFEQSKSLSDSLHKLTRAGFFYSTSNNLKAQLSQVLNKLKDDHFLQSIGTTGTQYIATGKWGLLYDFIDFQLSNELIEDLDDTLTKQDTLL
ncbi:MAG: hypothetical protein OXE99_11625 [Cellvibrionales bacterium]|nr:hypothetical protein [Cellvibrionales bacterium]